MIKQLSLFSPANTHNDLDFYTSFSFQKEFTDQERLNLEKKYSSLFTSDDRFDRKIVSFQANKGELVHSWLKYREGFSSRLVENLINDFGLTKEQTVIDPFAGSATTLLVAKTYGINAIGIDILPNCHLAWEAKSKFAEYDLVELKEILQRILNAEPGISYNPFPHIVITESAFPPENEKDLMWFSDWFNNLDVSENAKVLCKLILTSILEEISYTRKDGQYLRWDFRSEKLKSRNEIRKNRGIPTVSGIDKGIIPKVKEVLIALFREVILDIEILQTKYTNNGSKQELIHGTTLEILPTIDSECIDSVITSPPYANRYDYTRTYALELTYLGYGQKISSLRQELLSCTVESKSKIARLEQYYRSIGAEFRYQEIQAIIKGNKVLNEINQALKFRWEKSDMNNKGVLPMINQYFSELAFIFAELFRIIRPHSYVAFVNDNVRYGGEIIPVDTITTDFAESFGFIPIKIISLAQKKGNSSQQMERFGRVELRKCITIWKKP